MGNWIGPVRLPDEVKDRIVADYLAGESYGAIGKKVDRSGVTVRAVVRERGVDTRRLGEYRGGVRTGETPETLTINKEKELRRLRKKRAMNPERYTLYSARTRCRKKGLPFDLEVGDVTCPEFCPVLGVRLERNVGRLGPKDNSPTFDRIFPQKGYVKGNVRIISNKANRIKNDATLEELELVLADMKRIMAASGEERS